MSDERDLPPEQEARVARLLADARHDEPIPDDVAARLDQVLAGMSSEHVPGPDEQYAPVVDLAARRRRRAATLLVAAAAVIVAGVGIGQVVGSDDDAADGGSSSAADRAEEGAGQAGPATKPDALSESELEALGEPARVTTRSFAADVRRLQDRAGLSNAGSAMVSGDDLTAPRVDFACGPTMLPAGKLIAVQYNGSPAVLVYQRPVGETQVVDLVQCSSGETLRSTTLPLP